MSKLQISITLPDDVRAAFDAEAKRQSTTVAPLIRDVLVRLVRHDVWPRALPILDDNRQAIVRPPAAAEPAVPAAAAPAAEPEPAASLDVTGKPRAPDAFDDGYEPPRPPPAARSVLAATGPRWRYRAPSL